MAITKQDCLVLLNELKSNGEDVKELSRKAAMSNDVQLDVIEYINNRRQFDVSKFYEKLRKSYNDKKSQLYINIVKAGEVEEPKDVIITLSSLGLQIMLFAKNVSDPQMFLRHARYEELTGCLHHYSKTQDMLPAIKLLRLFKSDLKAFEYLSGRIKNGNK